MLDDKEAFARRRWLEGAAALLGSLVLGGGVTACGMKVGGPSGSFGGASGEDRVALVYLPKKEELEKKVTSALELAAGRPEPLYLEMLAEQRRLVTETMVEIGEPAPKDWAGPAPLGKTIGQLRAGGGIIQIKRSSAYMTLETDVKFKGGMPPGLIPAETMFGLTLKRLEEAREEARLEATYRHLDLALEMIAHRRQGGSFGDREEEFRRILAVARAADTAAALTISVVAATRACCEAKLPPQKLDELVERAIQSFPIEADATADEARALYDALETSLDDAIEALKAALRERFPPYLREQSDANIERLFGEYRQLATEEPVSPANAPPSASGEPEATGGVDLAGMANAGSALFPGLGVIAAGVDATTKLLDGDPRGAVEIAATMVPGGSVALGVVESALSLLGA